jgi:hypothetical protein
MSREAMKQALEAFDALYMNDYSGYEISKHETHIIDDAVKALRQALETEREWVGLTAYEIQEIHSGNQHWGNFACAIEAKLKEKNT